MQNHLNAVVLFSGGRDSTLASLRLAEQGYALTLVTVRSNHLVGLPNVAKRIDEIWPHMLAGTSWIIADQPPQQPTPSLNPNTCLPCQRDYTLCGFLLAQELQQQNLAFGYTGYQSDWPEQTPEAVERLRIIMADHKLTLMLPVLDLGTKEAARNELTARGLSDKSLEQKCLKQITNVALDKDELQSQLDAWESSLRSKLSVSQKLKTVVEKSKNG